MPPYRNYKKRKYSKRSRAKTAKGRSKRVARNTRAIAKITKDLYRPVQYKMSEFTDDASVYAAYPMVIPKDWEGIFTTNSTVEDGDRILTSRIIHRIQLQVESSVKEIDPTETIVGPIQYDVFMVSLPRATAKATLSRTNNLANMIEGEDFQRTEVGVLAGLSQTVLNKAVYKIHAHRKGRIGNYATTGVAAAPLPGEGNVADAAQTTSLKDTMASHTFNIPWKRTIQRGVGDFPGGALRTWKNMDRHAIEPHQQLYMLLFHSAFGLQEVSLAMSTMFYGRVPA